jgi:threonine/homoserine/homoserine lactone efflux protein
MAFSDFESRGFAMDFIPDLPVLAAYVVAAVALTLTPGPDMTLFLGKTLAQSRAAGFAAYGGASAGLVVHTVLASVGLSALLAASATAFMVLKVVGALYLLWLAYQALRHGSAFTPGEGVTLAPQKLSRVFLSGLGINLLNPKIIVFFVTFLPQFVTATDPHAAGKLMFLGLSFIVIATPFSAAMILGADRIAGLLKRSPKVTRVVDYLFASVLGGFAVKLLLTRAN